MHNRIDPIGRRPVPEPVLRIEREHRVVDDERSEQEQRRRKRPPEHPVDTEGDEPGHVDVRV